MTRLRHRPQPGTPAIPLSPHNNEITIVDAEYDVAWLNRRRKYHYVSAKAFGPDENWEVRLRSAIGTAELRGLSWKKSIHDATGERTFLNEDLRICVVCCLGDGDTIRLKRILDEGLEWNILLVRKSAIEGDKVHTVHALVCDMAAKNSQ